MLIDWFTVIAQIINFLILVALLKYFLYDRIIQVMDEREEKIASRLAEVEEKQKEAEQEATSYHQKHQEWEEQRAKMFTQTKEEVESRRKELLQQARKEVDAVQAQWHEAMQREKTSFLQALRQRAGRQIYISARRVLTDLANADLEQRIIEVFMKHMQELDEKRWEAIATSLRESREDFVIQSAFAIPKETRQKILSILQARFTEDMNVRFEISSEVMCGIELRTPGHQVAWSLENYLETLEEDMTQALAEEIQEEIPQTETAEREAAEIQTQEEGVQKRYE